MEGGSEYAVVGTMATVGGGVGAPPLPVLVFSVAVVCALAARLLGFRTRSALLRSSTTGWNEGDEEDASSIVKVLIECEAHEDLDELLWRCAKAADRPRYVQFGILITCTRVEDAHAGEVDPLLRSACHVEHAAPVRRRAGRSAYESRARRLVRRFVSMDERIVVFLDPRARLEAGWDRTLRRAVRDVEETASVECGVVTSPSRQTNGRPHFPSVRLDGRRREESAPVWTVPSDGGCVESVVHCRELTATTPSVARRWFGTRGGGGGGRGRGKGEEEESLLPSALHVRFFVPGSPVLCDDPALERETVRSSRVDETEEEGEGSTTPATKKKKTVTRRLRVGLTDDCDEREAVVKFGSRRAARIAADLLARP